VKENGRKQLSLDQIRRITREIINNLKDKGLIEQVTKKKILRWTGPRLDAKANICQLNKFIYY